MRTQTLQPLSVLLPLLIVTLLVSVGCDKLEDNEPPTSTYPLYIPEPSELVEPSEPSEPEPVQSYGNALVSESLKDSRTVGAINDGTLIQGLGLQLSGGSGFIRYSIPTTSSGYVQFAASGFVQDELHDGSEFKGMLLSMWSGTGGYSYENASFIFEVRKYGYIEGRADASNCLMFKIKSQGAWEQSPFHVLSWNSGVTYRIRIEWGGGQTSVYRDGQLVGTGGYTGTFAPADHHVQIGAQPLGSRESPHNLIISDVVIGGL